MNMSEIEELVEREVANLELPPKPNSGFDFSNHLIAIGVPKIPVDKMEKLKSAVKRWLEGKLQANDKVENVNNIELAVNENMTTGVAFVHFRDAVVAKVALKNLNNVAFDKKHMVKLFSFSQYEDLLTCETEYIEPAETKFKYQENMMDWLKNPHAVDQLLINQGGNVTIMEMSRRQLQQVPTHKELRMPQAFWCQSGIYLGSIHTLGVAVWGGPLIEGINILNHPGVGKLSFSPNESYIMSCNLDPNTGIYNIIVWNVWTGESIRQFTVGPEESQGRWPIFKWSSDGEYFARKKPDLISIYKSDTCELVDKKSIEAIGLRDFVWSHKTNRLAYWIAEIDNNPARLIVIDVPSKKEVMARSMIAVSNISLKWSGDDEYLAVLSEKYLKKKMIDGELKYQNTCGGLELYQMNDKDTPMEKIELPPKSHITDLSWEPCVFNPNSQRFVLLTRDTKDVNLLIFDNKQLRNDVRFQQTKLVKYSHGEKFCQLKWSPIGQVVAVIAKESGSVEIVDTVDGSALRRLESAGTNVHEWDPTGRYFMTSRICHTSKTDSDVSFYSIGGTLLFSQQFHELEQVSWRPRPPTPFVSGDQLKELKARLKAGEFSTDFAKQDAMMSSELKRKLYNERQRLMTEWSIVKKSLIQAHDAERVQRLEQRRRPNQSNEAEAHEAQSYMVLVSSRTEPLQ